MIDSPDVTPLDDHDESTAPTADPRPDGLRRAESLVVVNTGNGKGKSSSAFGMMVRAVARDWDVAVVQFIKSGNWNVGEEKVGRQLGVDWYAFGDGSRGTPTTCRMTSPTPPKDGRRHVR